MFLIRCRNFRPLLRSAKLFSTSTASRASFVAEPLPCRANVQVVGAEAGQFLQGLITNDIQLLDDDERKAMFAVFLNVQVSCFQTICVLEEGHLPISQNSHSSKLISLSSKILSLAVNRKSGLFDGVKPHCEQSEPQSPTFLTAVGHHHHIEVWGM